MVKDLEESGIDNDQIRRMKIGIVSVRQQHLIREKGSACYELVFVAIQPLRHAVGEQYGKQIDKDNNEGDPIPTRQTQRLHQDVPS